MTRWIINQLKSWKVLKQKELQDQARKTLRGMDLIKLEFLFRTVVLTWLCMNIEYRGLEAKFCCKKRASWDREWHTGCWHRRLRARNNCCQFEGNNWGKKTRNNCSQFESRLLRKNFLMSLASIGAAQITCLHWIKESQRKSHSQFPLRISKLHCLISFSCFHRFYLKVKIGTMLLELNISTNLVIQWHITVFHYQ